MRSRRSRWTEENDFFGRNHNLLKNVRNDCGGHLRLATARDVVQDKLHQDTTGMMEVDFGPSGKDVTVYMPFAYEFAAASLML